MQLFIPPTIYYKRTVNDYKDRAIIKKILNKKNYILTD